VKHHIQELLATALASLRDQPGEASLDSLVPEIERTRDPAHGDFASNLALQLAKPLRRKPRDIAAALVQALPASELVAGVEIAGPGFINFRLSRAAFERELVAIIAAGDTYGRTDAGAGQRVIVEFVSANPTGPLHVGHGRHAAYGATVANLLRATGYDVHREYYVNDAGRQMDILAVSLWLRLYEASGRVLPFPAGGYQGDYVTDIASAAIPTLDPHLLPDPESLLDGLPEDEPPGDRDVYLDALIARMRERLGEDGFMVILRIAVDSILADIRDDLAEFGVIYDQWFSEQSLVSDGAVDRALERVTAAGHTYQEDGATWFRATAFGDEKDRVVVRENGRKTYFASDIAYHLHKRERGFARLIDILGADHHGYVARVRAGLAAMGESPECLEVDLVQFVVLYRGTEKVQMSTRSGEFVTLRALREEVGDDAARLFFVSRSNDQHLDFDLELAKSRSNENPVYYIQYAHARVCSVLRELESRGLTWDQARGERSLARLDEPQETSLLHALSRYPEVLDLAARQRAPQHLVHYLRDLAHHLHTYYNAHRFIVEDDALRDARVLLVLATRQVLRNGLGLLGVSAPASM
jgi:arginyl-tRNA synthetase